jgi:hypothetical protein
MNIYICICIYISLSMHIAFYLKKSPSPLCPGLSDPGAVDFLNQVWDALLFIYKGHPGSRDELDKPR